LTADPVHEVDGLRRADLHADLAESEGIKIIISMSLGGPEPTEIIEEAIDYAISKGVIVVAAAGNNGLPMGWPAYPSGAPDWNWTIGPVVIHK
jgi:subtilisin family serine protease